MEIKEINKYGGKNYWLSFLIANGFNVPNTLFIPAIDLNSDYSSNIKTIVKDIKQSFINKDVTIAIRSSGLSEDSKDDSLAGRFVSKLNIPLQDAAITQSINEILLDAKNSGVNKMALVVQEFINPSFAGVLFSCKPNNQNKRGVFETNYVKGVGDKLMSGLAKATSLTVDIKNEKAPTNNALLNEKLHELVENVKRLEEILSFPVDVEWCIDKKTNELFILQCRPITHIFLKKDELFKLDGNDIKDSELLANDKVRLRVIGAKNNVMVGKAYILKCNCITDNLSDIDFSVIKESPNCSGYSVVIISPSLIDGKVIRRFTESSEGKVIKCNRYGVRGIVNKESLFETINDFYKIAKSASWTATFIIQELYDPLMTGIVKKSGDNFIIEVLRGHFAAKGIFPMSTYVVNKDFKVTYKNEVEQSHYYLIRKGKKIIYENTYNGGIVSINEEYVSTFAKQLSSIFVDPSINLEIGILQNNEELKLYLIDYTKENDKALSLDDLSSGVISSGCISAKLKRFEDINIADSIDSHFYNKTKNGSKSKKKIIYVCEYPNIQLQNLLEGNCENIGFIFKYFSSLCHFSILLRERSIPAIGGIDIDDLDYSKSYTIDTSIPGDVTNKLIENE